MKRNALLSVAVLFCGLLAVNLQAADTSTIIEGRILAVEPSKSITILITKSKGIMISLTEIQTLAVLDPKELTDNVKRDAAIVGVGSSVGASTGVINPPKGLQQSKFKNVLLIGTSMATLGALTRFAYNFLAQKPPMTIYDSNNPSFNDPTIINNLPIGTKIRITQKNHINGVTP